MSAELAPPLLSARGEGRADVRRIAYVLSLFPCYDETFILREMKALVGRDIALRIFSLRRKRHPVLQEDARPFLPATRYAAYVSGEVVGACLRALRRRPLALVGITGAILRGCWRRPLVLLRSLVMLPKSVLFAEVAAREGINHVHAHWATYPATTAWVVSRLTDIPWSFTCHAHDIFLDQSLLAEKLEAAAFVLTCTADNKRFLETVNPAARTKVRVSYHGLDLRLFRPSGSRPKGAEVEVLAVGSLLACKGFDVLIDACGILKRRGLSFRVTVAGGGPEEGRLREAIAQEGLEDCVRLTGYVTQASLVPLYQRADLFVLPAVLEIHWGIPNVLVEALACAVPVITTALPSLPELVEDGVQGLVAANRDATDLAEKMALLIQDPERRRAMGRAGRERVESRFDIERTIETVLQPLREGSLGES
jgi:colanic acid/amylovoran biosynthesis glycosyltransferase